jgi:hypothetical protein
MAVTVGVMFRLEGDACASADVRGQAYHYVGSDGDQRCSFGSLPEDGLYASVSAAEYGQARACGAFIDVQGPNGKSVRAKVVDRCASCAHGTVDLGERAFAELAPLSAGHTEVSWDWVRDPVPTPPGLAFRIKPDSHAAWMAVLVLDHVNPLTTLELKSGSSWRPLQRGLDNYWVASRPGEGPYTFRLADSYGDRRTVSSVRLAPGETQRSKVRMYDGPPSPMATDRSTTPEPAASATAESSAGQPGSGGQGSGGQGSGGQGSDRPGAAESAPPSMDTPRCG